MRSAGAPIADVELEQLVAIRAVSACDTVIAERGEDAERVPGAVGVPVAAATFGYVVRGHAGERVGDDDVAAIVNYEGMSFSKLQELVGGRG